MDIAGAIRTAREDQGLMISELARRAELTIPGVMAIESGQVKNPGIGTVIRIARALGLDPGDVLKAAEGLEDPAPKVVALPSTPLTDLAEAELDERLRQAGSAAKADKILRALEAEAHDLEEFYPRRVAPKLDRARLYAAAARDRWVKVADNSRARESNTFKPVSVVARELGGRYVPESERVKMPPAQAREPEPASAS